MHELAGNSSPAAHPIFDRLRKGYLRAEASTLGSLPDFIGPLPAEIPWKALLLAESLPGSPLRRPCDGLILAYLVLNIPATAAAVQAVDLQFTPSPVAANDDNDGTETARL